MDSDNSSNVDLHVAVEKDAKQQSIYDILSARRRYAILAVVSVGSILLPFSDTIYLPALHRVTEDLQTTETLTAASVAIYMMAIAVASLVWGPLSDRFGRRTTYWLCSTTFLAATIVCIFVPTIAVLLVFRALQGCAVTGFLTNGNAVVADIFAPERRGAAAGIFMVPHLTGPILGPLVGGGLSDAFGWRSTFIALAVFVVLVQAAIALILNQETQQWYVLQRLSASGSDPAAAAAASIKEAPSITRPVFHPPWQPLKMLVERAIAPHAVATLLVFSTMFASLVVHGVLLGAPPYNLSAGLIGVTYLPVGCGGFLTSPLGGRLADAAAAQFSGQSPEGRLVPATLVCVCLMPASLLVYGWTFQYSTHLAGPLIGHFFVGVALSFYLPAIFSYLSVIKQQQAAAANAAVQFLMNTMSGVFVLMAIPVMRAIGPGAFFSILAGLVGLALAVAGAFIVSSLRRKPGAPPPPPGVEKQQQCRSSQETAHVE